jgi:ribosomal protein L9
MVENIQLDIATLNDIPSVLQLQNLYLVANLSEDEKKYGFVTTPFSVAQLTFVINNQGLFIAKENNNVLHILLQKAGRFLVSIQFSNT